ncbi:MAG: adenylate/guanylate cyclase domain-containing protein [Chloroflexota bacterium]|nr:adenylate/guanylate cyclase domain-containing protein [Chloroflexota bacterium]
MMTERGDLERAIAALEAQRAILGDEVVDTMIAAAREKLAVLKAQRAVEQRKQVTVVFADVSGFTAIAETMDPEEVRDTMNAIWARLDAIIIAHGGTIDKHMGDAVMAIFGAPTAREDDPERAVGSALAMQKEFGGWRSETGRSESTISIRIGVHTGPALLGPVGATAEYTAMGDTVNLARRLQQAAPVGSVIVSHDTYRHVRGLFSVWMMEPVTVKGKTEPISIYAVLRARPRAFRLTSREVEGIETRMVGREAQLAQLQKALRAVMEQRKAQVVTVVGEAGVGKSRLLYEFDSWIALLLERLSHFKGRADEKMSSMPYFLIRDLFSFRFEIQDNDPAIVAREKLERGITDFMGADGVEKAHFIGHLIGFDFSASPYLRGILGDARQIHDRAFHYITQFFASVTKRSPAVLFLEDIHLANEGSLDLIDHLARECQHAPLLIICLTRPSLFEQRPSWGERQAAYVRLDLHPLSEENSRQLVAEILRKVDRIPPNLRDLIVSRAEGNPFYIEEFIKVLIEDDIIVKGAGQWRVRAERLTEIRVSSTIVGVLQARLDRLRAVEREVLQRASVVGRTFWDGAVVRISELVGERMGRELSFKNGHSDGTEIRAVLQTLCQKELIFRRAESVFAGEREYIFKHAILRDVTYESVLKRLRRVYHAQAAAWLFERSGERVGEYAGLIGEHYEYASETVQAAGWYGRAGKQARNTYAPDTAIGYYQKALALLLPDEAPENLEASEVYAAQQTSLYEGLAEMLLWQARYTEAAEACTAMRWAAETSGDAVAQARAWNKLSRTQDAQGDYHAALESAGQAGTIFRNAQIVDSAAKVELARALFRKGWGFYRLGDAEAALELGEQALALSSKLDAQREMADSLNLLGGVHSLLGHHGNAVHYNDRAVALYQELGDKERIGAMLNHLGEHARLRGDYSAAAALYQEALKIAYETGNRNGEMAFLSNLGGARAGMGEYRVAEYDLRRVIRWAEIVGQGGWLSRAYRFLADACLGQGKVDVALTTAQRALALGQEVEAPTLIGGAWRTLGRVLVEAARTTTIGDQTRDAASCFAESMQTFTAIGAEGERARTLREWARYEMDAGDLARGETMWREARAIFARLGMKLEVERMKDWGYAHPEYAGI